jgi:hypothetical protein
MSEQIRQQRKRSRNRLRRDALKDITRLLALEDHDALDEEMYQAFLRGQYAGCATCWAAFVARAALENRKYPLPDWATMEAE